MEEDVHDRGAIAQATLDLIQRKVTRVLDQIGVYSDLHPGYQAYALALNKSQRDLPDRVDRIREHQILRDRWGRRGLLSSVLDELDKVFITDIAHP